MSKAKAKAKAGSSLPESNDIPKGMRQVGGDNADTFEFENIGDSIQGFVSILPKELTLNKGKTNQNITRVMEITDTEDNRHAVWESSNLISLFDDVCNAGVGVEVYIRYDGLGFAKKHGQNPPRLFTAAIAE